MAVKLGTAPARQRSESKLLLDLLTDEELEVLGCLGLGQSNREIARSLGLKGKIVENACERIRKKLKLKTKNALIRYAVCWVEAKRN